MPLEVKDLLPNVPIVFLYVVYLNRVLIFIFSIIGSHN